VQAIPDGRPEAIRGLTEGSQRPRRSDHVRLAGISCGDRFICGLIVWSAVVTNEVPGCGAWCDGREYSTEQGRSERVSLLGIDVRLIGRGVFTYDGGYGAAKQVGQGGVALLGRQP
jgi:hypothetical protein